MKENRVGQPSTIGEIIIIPLEEVYLYCDKSEDGIWAYASKQPVGVVIISPQFKLAIDIQGEKLDLNTCIQDFGGLQQVIDNLENSDETSIINS
jgi:hypothetical protein